MEEQTQHSTELNQVTSVNFQHFSTMDPYLSSAQYNVVPEAGPVIENDNIYFVGKHVSNPNQRIIFRMRTFDSGFSWDVVPLVGSQIFGLAVSKLNNLLILTGESWVLAYSLGVKPTSLVSHSAFKWFHTKRIDCHRTERWKEY